MAFIPYASDDQIPAADQVPDRDHILRVHGVHPRAMWLHYQLYVEVMRGPSPLTRVQREMLAVGVSAANRCHY
ncbi:MAG: hypothetical protein ACREMW_10240 [Gemmatimonadales bacterium]